MANLEADFRPKDVPLFKASPAAMRAFFRKLFGERQPGREDAFRVVPRGGAFEILGDQTASRSRCVSFWANLDTCEYHIRDIAPVAAPPFERVPSSVRYGESLCRHCRVGPRPMVPGVTIRESGTGQSIQARWQRLGSAIVYLLIASELLAASASAVREGVSTRRRYSLSRSLPAAPPPATAAEPERAPAVAPASPGTLLLAEHQNFALKTGVLPLDPPLSIVYIVIPDANKLSLQILLASN